MIKNAIQLILFFLFLSFSLPLASQLSDNFDDGDLTSSPTWTGDIANFEINESLELQLNANGSGQSFIYTEIAGLTGDLQWDITVGLNFAPSNNNFNIIYLYLDNPDLALANGYYIRIGENGSDDTVELYELAKGNEALIGSGELGIFSQSPIRTRLRIIRLSDGLWNLSTDISDQGIYFAEFEASGSTSLPTSTGFFGLFCQYTSSNDNGFVFDNVSLSTPSVDNTPPQLLSIDVIADNILEVQYSESVSSSSSLDPNNYSINQGELAMTVELISERLSQYKVVFNADFTPNVENTLNIQNISDLLENKGNVLGIFILTAPVDLVEGDVLINEILFNPETGGVDFIEIINVTSKSFTINQLVIQNTQKSSGFSKDILSERIMQAQEILALTSDIVDLESYYPISGADRLIENSLPGFNDDEGNVSIYWNNDGVLVTLDSLNYSEDWHNPLIDNEGVSLERISTSLPTQNENSWRSASSTSGYATPGLPNSQIVSINDPTEEILEFENLTFSPDNDGIDDFLFIRIKPDLEGAIGKVKIFDSHGHLVKNLLNNSIFGSDNFVQWDGTTDEGGKSRIGPYIVQVEYFDLTGNKNMAVKACVLAGRFD